MKRDYVTLYCLLLLWGILALVSMGGYVFAGYAWWDHWGYETGTMRQTAVGFFHGLGLVALGLGVAMRFANPRF